MTAMTTTATNGTAPRDDVVGTKRVVNGTLDAAGVAGDTFSAATHGLKQIDEIWVKVPLTSATVGTSSVTVDAAAGDAALEIGATVRIFGSA